MYSRIILKNYDLFYDLLKFSLKYDKKTEFSDFSLVNNYLNILSEFVKSVETLFQREIEEYNEREDSLLVVFREENQKFDPLVNSKEKRDLINKFRVFMHIMDIVDERSTEEEEEGGLAWVKAIYNELKRIKLLLAPILKKINNIKLEQSFID